MILTASDPKIKVVLANKTREGNFFVSSLEHLSPQSSTIQWIVLETQLENGFKRPEEIDQ